MVKKEKIRVGWDRSGADLFLSFEGGEPRLLDYQFDGNYIHRICGGYNYYTSRSGSRGEGYLMSLNKLFKVDCYRVDSNQYTSCFGPIGKAQIKDEVFDVEVAVPYAEDCYDKSGILRDYPTVIKLGEGIVIYCNFEDLGKVLEFVFAQEGELGDICEAVSHWSRQPYRKMESTFLKVDSKNIEERSVVLEHYNLCSNAYLAYNTPNPWQFVADSLSDFLADRQELIYERLSVEKLPSGDFCRLSKIDGRKYRHERVSGNPLQTGNLTAGWEWSEENVIVRFYGDDVHVLAFAPSAATCLEQVQNVADRHKAGDSLLKFATTEMSYPDYEIYEEVVPKTDYLFRRVKTLDGIKKGLAKEVRHSSMQIVLSWLHRQTDETILSEIPDDMVIETNELFTMTKGKEFVEEFFSGKTEILAGELKPHTENQFLMSWFRRLAEEEARGLFESAPSL